MSIPRRHPATVLSEALIRQYLKINGYDNCLNEFNKIHPITPESETSVDELNESLQVQPGKSTFPSVIETFCFQHCLLELIETYESYLSQQSPTPSPRPDSSGEAIPQAPEVSTTPQLPAISQQPLEIPSTTGVKPEMEVENTEQPVQPTPPPAPQVEPTQPEPPKVVETYTAPDGKVFNDRQQYRRYLFKNYYSYSNRSGETLRKSPGDIEGQQFALDHITDCTVEILDYSASVTCDFITNSMVLFGPVSDSIFVRNCEGCTFYISARQVRTRDCVNCIFYTYSSTEPVIETSHHLQFAPYLLWYPKLKQHAEKAKLDSSNNQWSKIFDFNKDDPSIPQYHWKLLNRDDHQPKKVEIEGLGDVENPFSTTTTNMFSTNSSMKSFSITTSQEAAQAVIDKTKEES